jgi:hypothetical protein
MFLEIVKLVGGGIMTIAMGIMFLECMSQGSFISDPLKEASERRAAMRRAEQRHRHRIELLQQLEKIAAFEGLANHDKNSEYAKLRDNLLAELDVNLDAAENSELAAPKRAARRRTRT